MADIKNKNMVDYTKKDYANIKESLINMIKYYYGDKYTDFSETSIGDMLLDVSAYVGDLLTYNIDYNVNQLLNPTTRIGAISYAKLRGYKPRAAKSSSGLATFTITIPGDEDSPNLNYYPILYSGTQVRSNLDSDKIYELIEDIDFKVIDPKLNMYSIEITKSEVGGNIYYIIQKKGKIVSGAAKTFSYTFTTPQKYMKLQIPSNKISEIIEVTDSLDNTWYQVDSLAQETIFTSEANTDDITKELTPNLVKIIKTSKRFEVEIDENNYTYLLFGAGTESQSDEELIPSPDNVLKGLENIDVAISPESFLKTTTFGEAPYNTTLTISYRESNGEIDNAKSTEVDTLSTVYLQFPVDESSLPESNTVKKSLTVVNNEPIIGARSVETIEEIKLNSNIEMSAQKRCVIKEDFIIRALSLPEKYGLISKAYAEKAGIYLSRPIVESKYNIDAFKNDIVLHVLSSDSDNRLTIPNTDTKENLKKYLSQYRMISDNIHIVDGKIINFRIHFKIKTKDIYNKNSLVLQIINKLKDYFDISKWNFNDRIILSDVYELINSTKGVVNVSSLRFTSLAGEDNYSNYRVDFNDLEQDGIIHPPNDISIFELKYPKIDIIGIAN